MAEIYPDKEKLIVLISEWLKRSGLSFRRQIVPRIQTAGIDISEAALADRLTRRPERKPDLAPNLALAVVTAFTQRLTDKERCQASEALLFADLVRLPISQFEQLGRFFPEDEFNYALSRYISLETNKEPIRVPSAILIDFYPKVSVSRKGSKFLLDADFLMPLYPYDTIHTYREASVVFLCQNNKSLFRVPEQSVSVVDCNNDKDKYFVEQLDGLLDKQRSETDAHLFAEGRVMTRVETILTILGNQEMGNWSTVIAQLTHAIQVEKLQTPYLLQRLGDGYWSLNQLKNALNCFQLAQELAHERGDRQAQRSALLSINRLNHGSLESHVVDPAE